MAGRRSQVRTLFSSIPSSSLGDISRDALLSRSESYIAAVDVWATKGNAKSVHKAGTGLVPLCAWLAAKSFDADLPASPFQKVSGLTPTQFNASAKELSMVVATRREASSYSSAASSTPSTPRRRDALEKGEYSTPADRTPESLTRRAKDVMSGAAFGLGGNPSSPRTPKGRTERTKTTSSSRSGSSLVDDAKTIDSPTPPAGGRRLNASQATSFHTPSKGSRLRQDIKTTPGIETGVGSSESSEEEEDDEEDEDENENDDDKSFDASSLDEEQNEAEAFEQIVRRERSGRSGKRYYPFALKFDEGEEEVEEQGRWEQASMQKRLKKHLEVIKSLPDDGSGWEEGKPVATLILHDASL